MKFYLVICVCLLVLAAEVFGQQDKSPFLRRRRPEAQASHKKVLRHRMSEDFVVSNKGKEYAASCREEPGCEWECGQTDNPVNNKVESLFCICKCRKANRIVAHRFVR